MNLKGHGGVRCMAPSAASIASAAAAVVERTKKTRAKVARKFHAALYIPDESVPVAVAPDTPKDAWADVMRALGDAGCDEGPRKAALWGLARLLERALWVRTLDTCARDRVARFWENATFRNRYTTRAMSLAFNLRHPRNPALRHRVLGGKVSPVVLVSMGPEDMFPELYAPIYARLASKHLRQMAVDEKDAPDGPEDHRCRACKSLKTQYYLLQTRSADEPMTVFVSCLGCGKRWKH